MYVCGCMYVCMYVGVLVCMSVWESGRDSGGRCGMWKGGRCKKRRVGCVGGVSTQIIYACGK